MSIKYVTPNMENIEIVSLFGVPTLFGVNGKEAIDYAERNGGIAVVSSSKPFTVDIIDKGRAEYLQRKNNKKATNPKHKTIKIGTGCNEHDILIKKDKIRSLLDSGYQVTILVLANGRNSATRIPEIIEDICAAFSTYPNPTRPKPNTVSLNPNSKR